METSQNTEKLVKKYSDLKGELHLVQLSRCGFKSLGMSLVGNKDLTAMSIFVCKLKKNYPAAKSGKIFVGDELLEVNGKVLYGRSHLNSTPIFNSLSSDTINLIILRNDESVEKMAVSSTPEFYPAENTCNDTMIKRLPVVTTPFDLSMDSETAPLTPLQSLQEDDQIVRPISVQDTILSTCATTSVQSSSVVSTCANIYTSQIPSHNTTTPTSSIQLNSTTPSSTQLNRTTPPPSSTQLNRTTSPICSTQSPIIRSSIPSFSTTIKPISPKNSPKPSSTVSTTLTKELKLTTIVTSETTTIRTPPISRASLPDGGTMEQEDNKKKPNLKLDLTKTQNTPPRNNDDSVFVDEKVDTQSDPLTTTITTGKSCLIEITCDKQPLGLRLVGGSDTSLKEVFAYEVYEGGMARKDGRLRVADQIIEINGKKTSEQTQNDLFESLRTLSATVKLLVLRQQSNDEEELSLYKSLRHKLRGEEMEVEMVRRASRPLGLCVKPVWNHLGLLVHQVMSSPGFLLEESSVRVGDEVLQVNGTEVQYMDTTDAINFVKTLFGSLSLKLNRLEIPLANETTSPCLLSPTSPHNRLSTSSTDKNHEIKRSKSLIRRAIPACLTGVAH